MTFVAAAVVGAVATVGGALIGSGASKSAAKTQASAAENAAALQAQVAQEQLAAQKEMFNKQIELQEPWRQAGINALTRMQAGEYGLPGEFRPTTGLPGAFTGQVNMQADPGYQFRLSEGMKALDRQAAARGGLISGAALKGAQRFGQDYASQEYQNAYNRALTEYQSKVQQSQMGYGREMDVYNAALQRSGLGFNRLASPAGLGQTSVGQLTSAAGAYGQNGGNILGASGAAQAAGITGAANAQAAGTVGMANALTGGISSGINQYYQNQLMNRLFTPSAYDTPASYGWTDQYANDFMGSYGQG